MFNIIDTPFSRRGSYLAVVARVNEPDDIPRVVVHSLRGMRPGLDLFRVTPADFSTDSSTLRGEAVPWLLTLSGAAGAIEACFADPTTVRLRSHDAGLSLIGCTGTGTTVVVPLGRACIDIAMEDGWTYRVTALRGNLEVDAPWDGVSTFQHLRLTARAHQNEQGVELSIEEYQAHRPPPRAHPDFDVAVASARTDFATWLDAMPAVPETLDSARELCAYTCWSTIVEPSGLVTRPTMYMSKNRMHGVWSWDHCFNAMALANTHPDLAWHQYMTVFDHIDAGGMLPDWITDTNRGWAWCKPPVHGWTLRWLMRNSQVATPARIAEIYPLLESWTHWWFSDRDDNKDGIPQYNHGNESGWDNSTAFAAGVPIDSPDLSAYLIVQMDTIADLARRLGRHGDAKYWGERSDALLANMLTYFAEGPDLVARHTHTGEPIRHASLLAAMPLVAGRRLPHGVRSHMLEQLRSGGPHSTLHGLATEALASRAYQPDGYWRGPIWAPTTFLLTESMRELGEGQLADQVARRFCNMIRTSGPSENFDATSGKGLREPAFSWTASTFLLLSTRIFDDSLNSAGE